MTPRERLCAVAILLLAVLLLGSSMRSEGATAPPATRDGAAPVWAWPVDGGRVITAPYRAPASAYGAGHRGIDLPAPRGTALRAPADGVVAFRGTVVDRALVTIEHEGGYVSTFEPLASELAPGDVVRAADVVGTVDAGGHAFADTIHLGVRLDGAYINPLLLFGEVPRSVLLPCCEAL